MSITDIASLATLLLNLFFIGMLVRSAFLFYRYCMFNKNFSIYARGVPLAVVGRWEKAKLSQMRWLIWTPLAWLIVLLNVEHNWQLIVDVFFLFPIAMGFKFGIEAKRLVNAPANPSVPVVISPEIHKKIVRKSRWDEPLMNPFRKLSGQEIQRLTRRFLVSCGFLFLFLASFEKESLSVQTLIVLGALLIATGIVRHLKIRGFVFLLYGLYFSLGLLFVGQINLFAFGFAIACFYWVIQISVYLKKADNQKTD